ncbi:MAG: sensor histidine kinase [Bacteroidota bacterium]
MDDFQKVLLREANRFADYERARIAKNLHDDVSMLLNVAKFNLATISKNNNDKILTEKLATESLSLLDESIEHIRNMAKSLSPPTLMKLGYAKGILELCNQIRNSSRIKVQVNINEVQIRLPHPLELEVYRITQEILNNIIKHSRVVEINVSIDENKKGLKTIISYNGFGLDSKMADELSETDKGVGLKSIQDRATMIGATVQYAMIACNQYKTTIEVPVYEKSN